MDNQHQKIKGYRDLSQEEIDLMNRIKEHAEDTRVLIHDIEVVLLNQTAPDVDNKTSNQEPMRWLNIARTDLQKGFMSLVRSVAQPTTF